MAAYKLAPAVFTPVIAGFLARAFPYSFSRFGLCWVYGNGGI
jgi:hypothetical protein